MRLGSKINHFFGMKESEEKREVLYAPLSGRVLPLSEVKDETFAGGILGEGAAILPADNVLTAPTDATVTQVFDSAHAVTLLTDDGAELLLHVGIDTVELGGKHFDCPLREGMRVERGDVLIRFDGAAIEKDGYELTTPLVVCNSDEFEILVVAHGAVDKSHPLLELKRKGKRSEGV